jgi:virulence-associated protein D homolog
MYAVTFDLCVEELIKHFGPSYTRGYSAVKAIAYKYNFYWAQGSVYISREPKMNNLFSFIHDLKELSWFCSAVQDIRVFRVEDDSEITQFFKSFVED